MISTYELLILIAFSISLTVVRNEMDLFPKGGKSESYFVLIFLLFRIYYKHAIPLDYIFI